jgi:hypothetical protein
MPEFILIAHIGGGVATGVFVAGAFAHAAFGFFRTYRTYITASLLGLSAFQIASGTILSVLSHTVSALALCNNVTVYLLLVAAALLALEGKNVLETIVANHRSGFVSLGASVGAFLAALVLGV